MLQVDKDRVKNVDNIDISNLNQQDAKLIGLARQIHTQEEIANILGVSTATVFRRMNKYRISSYEDVKKILKRNPNATNEEVAEIANVDAEAVGRLREKLTKKDINTQLVQLARQIHTQREIANTLGVSTTYVFLKMREYGILSSLEVKSLIRRSPDAADEEIARIANVDVDAVKRLREEKKKDINAPDSQDEELVKLAKKLYTPNEIANTLGISYHTVTKRMQKYGILPSVEVKKLIRRNPKASAEEIAEQAKVEVDAVERLRSQIIKFGVLPSRDIKKIIQENPEATAEEIANETGVDIELVAKIRENNKAIEVSEKEEDAFTTKRKKLLNELECATDASKGKIKQAETDVSLDEVKRDSNKQEEMEL